MVPRPPCSSSSPLACGGHFIDAGYEELIVPALWPDITELVRAQIPGPSRVFYVARCFRDDPPTPTTFREFTQVGVERIGGTPPDDRREVLELLARVLDTTGVAYELDRAAPRDPPYEDGFAARAVVLGERSTIAAGGRYPEGVGWAIGLERLALAVTP